MLARLRLLQIAANLEVFCPNSCSGKPSARPTQPYDAAGARRTHIARLLDQLEDQHLIVRQTFEPGAECGGPSCAALVPERKANPNRGQRTSQAPPA